MDEHITFENQDLLTSNANDDLGNGLHTIEESIELKDFKTNERFYAHILLAGDKVDVYNFRRRVSYLMNKMNMSKSTFWRVGAIKLIEVLEKELNEEGNPYALAYNKMKEIRERKAIDEMLTALRSEVDERNFTLAEFEEICIGYSRDPSQYNNGYAIELPKSSLIEQWFYAHVTSPEGHEVNDIRKNMGTLIRNEKDWNLAKNLANKLTMSRGKRGIWFPPRKLID